MQDACLRPTERCCRASVGCHMQYSIIAANGNLQPAALPRLRGVKLRFAVAKGLARPLDLLAPH